VIYPQSDPKHAYYYNPYKKSYWGRCPSQTQGKPLYSLLKPEHRKPRLEEIAEDEFPSPSDQLPPIPESIDSVVIDLPPDDLPADLP
jgi:hypothetical protein